MNPIKVNNLKYLIVIPLLTICFDATSQLTTKFIVYFDSSKKCYANTFNLIKYRNYNNCFLAMDEGVDGLYLINYYVNNGRLRHFGGEDILNYKPFFYTDLIDSLSRFDKTIELLATNPHRTDIRQKFTVLEGIISISLIDEKSKLIMDELYDANFRCRDSCVLNQANYFINKLENDSILLLNLFGKNTELAKNIIDEIKLNIKLIDKKYDLNDLYNYYSKQFENKDIIYVTNPNIVLLNYIKTSGFDIEFHSSKNIKKKYLKDIKTIYPNFGG